MTDKKNLNKTLKKINGDLNIKNKVKGVFYIAATFHVLIIAYISFIIYYLNQLKICQCFNDKNNENYSNLDYLLFIEYLILTMNIIFFIFYLYVINLINTPRNGGGNNNQLLYYISFFILLALYSYFIYYVYKLHENIDKNCKCANTWFRYLLYFQAILMLINICLIISSSIM